MLTLPDVELWLAVWVGFSAGFVFGMLVFSLFSIDGKQ
jgi:hypothetical protein